MAYATANDMIARFDERTLGQLLSDDDIQVDVSEFAANTKMVAALAGASGDIRSELLRGQRYSEADLSNLTADDKAFLVDMNCWGAFVRLYMRKPYADKDQHKDINERFERNLESMRRGEKVFGEVTSAIEAGRPLVETVTRVQAEQWHMRADSSRPRFFPRRQTFRNR